MKLKLLILFLSLLASSAYAQAPALKAVTMSTSTIQLHWSGDFGTATGFYLQRRENPAAKTSFVRIAQLPITTLNFLDSGLNPNSVYEYRLQLFTKIGSTTTAGEIFGYQTGYTTLPVLNLQKMDSQNINVVWNDNYSSEYSFQIERREFPAQKGSFLRIRTMPANSTSFVDQNLRSQIPYQYRARMTYQIFENQALVTKYGPYFGYSTLTLPTASENDVPEPAYTSEVWVDDDGLQAQGLPAGKVFSTIAEAHNAVLPGGIVRVLPGLYLGVQTLTKTNVHLIAMKDQLTRVNPRNLVTNTDWPVILEEHNGGNAVQVVGGASGIMIQGFFIRKAGFNGVHLKMQGGMSDFQRLCENITVAGNRIENVAQDGIKVNQCQGINIIGNLIANFALQGAGGGEQEQGIDFMATANAVVRGNRILAGGTGITAKGGSINVLIEENQFMGPFRWDSVTVGEPAMPEYSFLSSYDNPTPYAVKNVVIRNNLMDSYGNEDIIFWACQNCSATGNILKRRVTVSEAKGIGKTLNICVDPGVPVNHDASMTSNPVTYGSCPQAFEPPVRRNTSVGIDYY